MKLNARTLLLLVAVVLFVIAAISDSNSGDMLAFGLAAFAAAFLVDDVGIGRRR